ncbi:MAG: Lar family restriction alleviation protein [Synergistaceae bacterium]|nr:Lar family restriction alleviation protein [Synergistaceae bacterium]
MGELKRCPFCGGEADVYSRGGRYGVMVYVKCERCDAQTRVKSAKGSSKDKGFWDQLAVHELENLWNMRVDKDGD